MLLFLPCLDRYTQLCHLVNRLGQSLLLLLFHISLEVCNDFRIVVRILIKTGSVGRLPVLVALRVIRLYKPLLGSDSRLRTAVPDEIQQTLVGKVLIAQYGCRFIG